MSIESARAFVERIREDEELRKSFMATGSKERAMELAEIKGFDFTLEEIEQVRQEQATKSKENEELSDEDLEQVSGGGWCWDGWCWG